MLGCSGRDRRHDLSTRLPQTRSDDFFLLRFLLYPFMQMSGQLIVSVTFSYPNEFTVTVSFNWRKGNTADCLPW